MSDLQVCAFKAPHDLVSEMRRAAREDDRSVSSLIRVALRRALAERIPAPDGPYPEPDPTEGGE